VCILLTKACISSLKSRCVFYISLTLYLGDNFVNFYSFDDFQAVFGIGIGIVATQDQNVA